MTARRNVKIRSISFDPDLLNVCVKEAAERGFRYSFSAFVNHALNTFLNASKERQNYVNISSCGPNGLGS